MGEDSDMDNPFPKGRATGAYNYVLIMSKRKIPQTKHQQKIPQNQGSCLSLLLALQKGRRSTGIIFKCSFKQDYYLA